MNIEGCLFHLWKRSDFKVKQFGLTNKYRNDADFKIRIKKLAAQAFIPLKMLCQFTKSWRIDLRTMSFPSSHTLKAHGLGTSFADGDATLHLTFYFFIKRVIIKSLQCHLKLKNENGTPKPCKLLKGAAHGKMS